MCRTGVYTNAEYLQLRYTASLRIASAILQVLYRFVAMALVVYAMATMFRVIIGIDLWHGVWAAMILTLAYVAASGQLGVVMAAIPQVALMLVTSVLVFTCAAVEIGGWQGFCGHLGELGDRVRLAGLVQPSEIPELLWAMDMLVHTSLHEGLPRAVVQGLLAGLPALRLRPGPRPAGP